MRKLNRTRRLSSLTMLVLTLGVLLTLLPGVASAAPCFYQYQWVCNAYGYCFWQWATVCY
jgi:hypothetical protein